jgi:hypothetical protein
MTYNVGVASILIAGLGLVVESLGGLYWLVITTIVFFVWASLQAWYLLIEPP